MNTCTSTTDTQAAMHGATLIGSVATAYQGLTPEAAAGLRAVFGGNTSMQEAHRVAGLVIDTTPREELQIVLTRLITMATDTEADVMVHGAPNGFEGVRNHG